MNYFKEKESSKDLTKDVYPMDPGLRRDDKWGDFKKTFGIEKMSKFLFTFLLGFFFSFSAYAALSPQDQQDVQRVETYMNTMQTVKADFVQVAPSGTVYNGVFYLKRPGRLRFEYATPSKNFVVADGAFIHFWDDKNKNQSSAPISQTLADFLLRKQIKLSGEVTATEIIHGAGTLTVKVVEAANPNAGSLTLVLEDRPLRLQKWRVEDPSGVTEVTLLNPQFGLDLDPGLFRFVQPAK